LEENEMSGKAGMRVFSALLVVLLVGAFMPVVSAEPNYESIVCGVSEVRYRTIVDDTEITVNSNLDATNASILFKSNNISREYIVAVEQPKHGRYIAKIYSAHGEFIGAKEYSRNPLISENGDLPLILGDIPVVEAHITITPDSYNYIRNQYGTVNLHVQNFAPDGFTNYFLKIPDGVEYTEVYHGKQPTTVQRLAAGESTILPKYGIVNGPCTILSWMDVHLFSYDEEMKIKVKFSNLGRYTFYAYDHEQEVLLGIPSWDDDQFTVTVS
jgi:hypothetical protein